MKLSINKNTLESALALCASLAEKKDDSAINSHLLLEANDDKLIIKATDYEFGISYKITKLKIEENGFATAQAKNILEMVKSLANEDILIETVENSLFIKQKYTKYKLSMFDYKDFPELQNKEGKDRLELDSDNLRIGLKKTVFAIDNDNPKPSLNGALINVKNDRINFVGTDTKRLAIYTVMKENQTEFNLSIPKKSIIEMQKLFYEKVELFADKNVLIMKSESDNFEFFTKLINDTFPDYEKVIPKKISKEFSFKTEDFADSLKKVSVACDKMKLHFKKNKLVFEGIIIDNMEAKTELDLELDLEEEFSLNITIKHLLDFINSIEADEFKFFINEPNQAFVIRSDELETIIMPAIV
ncbi:DNA polymerase III subunit beta [Campylobacter troglodytis]|uniref:DNA polymerase III subunit beta n=1 Tax=Campylobacter troglodytis TaxID=654363 RepID=UPI001159E12F|nr:DNA polymerase III subunit beta [Campylobacter troglodytis]TQR58179.1 DNA polymerase III subunit beta [Campylobacter troglodytis]